MDGKLTIREAIQMIANELTKIPVPAGLTEQIAVPIACAISGLRECVKAIEEAEAEQKTEKG